VKEFKSKSTKNRKKKQSLEKIHKNSIAIRKKASIQSKTKVTSLKNKVKKYEEALGKIFTNKQISLLVEGGKHKWWTAEDIGKAISIRYKANTYDYLRALKFPFPSTRTLQRWTQRITLSPGIMYPVMMLLKDHFAEAPEIMRQCVLLFDEMHLDSSMEYDAADDRIYGPKNNMNVYFLRGLFDHWKQPIAFEFDEEFCPLRLQQMIMNFERIGLNIRALISDLGGKNRGVLNKLGVRVRSKKNKDKESTLSISPFFANPFRPEEKIWYFADAPHIMKLLLDNCMKYGLNIKDNHLFTKQDF
jgi:hypothetical protein